MPQSQFKYVKTKDYVELALDIVFCFDGHYDDDSGKNFLLKVPSINPIGRMRNGWSR